MAVSMPQPPIIIVALKQPTSRAPPSSTKAAMVRSAIRPFLEVPQVTQRSQNSLAVAGAEGRRHGGMLAARLRVQGRVGEPEQVLRLFPRLVPDRGPADRVGHVAAHHRRGGGMAGPVRGLRRGRYQGLQVTVVLEADNVDQVAGFEPREANLDPAGGLR